MRTRSSTRSRMSQVRRAIAERTPRRRRVHRLRTILAALPQWPRTSDDRPRHRPRPCAQLQRLIGLRRPGPPRTSDRPRHRPRPCDRRHHRPLARRHRPHRALRRDEVGYQGAGPPRRHHLQVRGTSPSSEGALNVLRHDSRASWSPDLPLRRPRPLAADRRDRGEHPRPRRSLRPQEIWRRLLGKRREAHRSAHRRRAAAESGQETS